MAQLRSTKTVYKVSQFLQMQRSGVLELRPVFQRKDVWRGKEKSLLIDTVVNGLPMPIIFLREKEDIDSLRTVYEVVDGQQRLRTLLAFIEPSCLPDFNAARDAFSISKTHNRDLGGKVFEALPRAVRSSILAYEISVHLFPPGTGDAEVLKIFARINSTGSRVNYQELRNAQWFGEFKTLSYDLALQNLETWRRWEVFGEDDFARMREVEAVSDYLIAMMHGIQGKTKRRLDAAYEEYDDDLPGSSALSIRFQKVIDTIDKLFGAFLPATRFTRQVLFYSLFVACYDHMYGLSPDHRSRRSAKPLPKEAPTRLKILDARIASGKLDEEFRDAMERATSHPGRRNVRHRHFMRALGLDSRT